MLTVFRKMKTGDRDVALGNAGASSPSKSDGYAQFSMVSGFVGSGGTDSGAYTKFFDWKDVVRVTGMGDDRSLTSVRNTSLLFGGAMA